MLNTDFLHLERIIVQHFTHCPPHKWSILLYTLFVTVIKHWVLTVLEASADWMKNLGDLKSWQVHEETICYDEPLGTHATTNTRPILLGCHQCIENSTKPYSVPMNGLQTNTNTNRNTNTNTNTPEIRTTGTGAPSVLPVFPNTTKCRPQSGASHLFNIVPPCMHNYLWHLFN